MNARSLVDVRRMTSGKSLLEFIAQFNSSICGLTLNELVQWKISQGANFPDALTAPAAIHPAAAPAIVNSSTDPRVMKRPMYLSAIHYEPTA